MKTPKPLSPVLKWVGGKRQLLNTFASLLPAEITEYCEPFVGGGALLFSLQLKTAYINDVNTDLIRVYEVVKNDVESLISSLREFRNEADDTHPLGPPERPGFLHVACPMPTSLEPNCIPPAFSCNLVAQGRPEGPGSTFLPCIFSIY